MSRLYVCVFFVLAITCDAWGQVGSLCRPNERLLPCGGCQKTCDNPEPVCEAVCHMGCYCNNDEVRNATGHCVKLSECPPDTLAAYKSETTEPRPQSCPENEEYRFCEPCNRTCDNPNTMCPAQCARGCFCKGELLRDADGKCVEYQFCSKFRKHEISNFVDPIPYRINCGPYQRYKKCETCEKTCSNPNPSCPTECKKGCFCEHGLVKSPSGDCVKLEQCPKASSENYIYSPQMNYSSDNEEDIANKAETSMNMHHDLSVEDCGSDEEYLSCGWCEPSCRDRSPRCQPGSCTRGCLCRPPLLRHHSGRCVAAKDCDPQRCMDPYEEYVCRYGCEARCDRFVCYPRPKRCQTGCHCRLGYLRDVNGNCVLPSNCTVSAVARKPNQYVIRGAEYKLF